MRVAALFVLLLNLSAAFADEIRIYPGNRFHVIGDEAQEWRFQHSTNLLRWWDSPYLGTMFSGSAVRPVTNNESGPHFLRAVETAGLFDDRAFRTIHLTFPMTNWVTLLDRARTSGSNVLCTLAMDNGLTNLDVGARYKGNSSYSMGGAKKSLNLDIDFKQPDADLMGHTTVNLNNAAGDETILREPLYFNVMNEYAPSPKAVLARLFINGAYWGVYSMAQQENSVLVREWFPSTDGDRWRTANIGSGSAMVWRGTNVSSYRGLYDLRRGDTTNAWLRLVNAISVLNNTPTNVLRDRLEEVFAVDRWLWFLAVENIFADEDSYVRKGADYSFYYEIESGRIHPIEHDGNEAFFAGDVSMSPVLGATDSERPLLRKMLGIPELRQRYLAHAKTVLKERYNPDYLTPVIDRMHQLSVAAIIADPKKPYAMGSYTNDLRALRSFVTNRYKFLTNHLELRSIPPVIESVNGPEIVPTAYDLPTITAKVSEGVVGEKIDSVWLYWRGKDYGRFSSVQMFDDGAHNDGAALDHIYGAVTTNHPAGTKVNYYVEARAGNASKTAAFSPARAEQVTYSYQVRVGALSDSPVVINEILAENRITLADPQGEFDDWIELYNGSDEEVDVGGWYLSDDADNPRKWAFPVGTKIAAGGYLIVWADEDGTAAEGLHANFKLSNDGEQVLLVGPDEQLNALVDSVSFGKQGIDYSHGRDPENTKTFKDMTPSPGSKNL